MNEHLNKHMNKEYSPAAIRMQRGSGRLNKNVPSHLNDLERAKVYSDFSHKQRIVSLKQS